MDLHNEITQLRKLLAEYQRQSQITICSAEIRVAEDGGLRMVFTAPTEAKEKALAEYIGEMIRGSFKMIGGVKFVGHDGENAE